MSAKPTPSPEDEPIQRPDVEARILEMRRIQQEIARVRGEIESERGETAAMTEEEQERRAAWDSMTSEEKAESLRELRALLEDNREEFEMNLPEANVDLAISHLDASAARVVLLERLEDELADLLLQTHADQADVTTRLVVRMAEMMHRIENLTEQEWQDIPPSDRAGMMDLLNEWNGGRKAEILGQLPIEVRRRFE